MTYKAIIFDLDGTLLDTLDDLADSMNQVLIQLGFPTHAPSAYKLFVGEGVEYLAEQALPKNNRQPSNIQKCVELMRLEYAKRWASKTKIYKGIPELLKELAHQKIKISILSNKPDDFTKVIVKKFLSEWNFEIVQGALKTSPKKPDPQAALKIAQKCELAPHQFIFLGDTKIDMQTACAAGMHPVGAAWGFRSAEELITSGAKALINVPQELLSFFSS